MPIDDVRDALGTENARYVRALERKLRNYEERIGKLETTIQYLIQRAG